MASRPCQIPAGFRGAGWLRIECQGVGMSGTSDIAGPGTRHRVGRITAIEASGCGGISGAGLVNPCSDLNPGFGSGLGLGPGSGIRLNRSLSLSLSLSLNLNLNLNLNLSRSFMLSFCFNNGDRRTWDARCLAVRFGPWRARAVGLGRGPCDPAGARRPAGDGEANCLAPPPYLAGRRWWCWRSRGRGARAGPRDRKRYWTWRAGFRFACAKHGPAIMPVAVAKRLAV